MTQLQWLFGQKSVAMLTGYIRPGVWNEIDQTKKSPSDPHQLELAVPSETTGEGRDTATGKPLTRVNVPHKNNRFKQAHGSAV
jgi:hypothetical protein